MKLIMDTLTRHMAKSSEKHRSSRAEKLLHNGEQYEVLTPQTCCLLLTANRIDEI